MVSHEGIGGQTTFLYGFKWANTSYKIYVRLYGYSLYKTRLQRDKNQVLIIIPQWHHIVRGLVDQPQSYPRFTILPLDYSLLLNTKNQLIRRFETGYSYLLQHQFQSRILRHIQIFQLCALPWTSIYTNLLAYPLSKSHNMSQVKISNAKMS